MCALTNSILNGGKERSATLNKNWASAFLVWLFGVCIAVFSSLTALLVGVRSC